MEKIQEFLHHIIYSSILRIVKEIVQRARQASLSKNAEKHIRKHYREFGYVEKNEFTKERMIETAHRITKRATQVLYHESKHGDSIIFFDGTYLLIVDTKKNVIKTMFAVEDKEYIKRKIQNKFWKELKKEEFA